MQTALAPEAAETRGTAGVHRGGRLRAVMLYAAVALLAAACTDRADDPAVAAKARQPLAVQPGTIMTALEALDEFAVLRRALIVTGRDGRLRGSAPLTLLAPRDTAFAKLDPERRAALLAAPTRSALARALDGLVIARPLRADELKQSIARAGGTLTLQSGAGPLAFTLGETGQLTVTTPSGLAATMSDTETSAGNGTMFVLDSWIAATP